MQPNGQRLLDLSAAPQASATTAVVLWSMRASVQRLMPSAVRLRFVSQRKAFAAQPGRLAANIVGLLAASLAACGASQSSTHASLYDCTVVQLRNGGSCEEPLPNCSGSGAGVPWT